MSVPRLTQLFEAAKCCDKDNEIRFKTRQRDDYLFKSAEYSANQTAVSMIAAPGAGYRIVVKGVWMTTASNAGAVTLNGTADAATIIISKAYSTLIPSFSEAGVSVPLDENTAVTMTSTTGAVGLTVSINYVVDKV